MCRNQKYSESGLWLISISACILLPLTGILFTGRPIRQYLEFPPLTRYVSHADFSPVIFLSGTFLVLLLLLLFLFFIITTKTIRYPKTKKKLPWWGYVGFMVIILTWIPAWNRFSWFAVVQPYTFTPLWIGYIITINAITWCKNKTCLLTESPKKFFLLFPLSALFWWYFEFLNRFVQNWYYVGIEGFSTRGYIIHASICFSTVLPAVLSTTQLFTIFFSDMQTSSRQSMNQRRLGGWAPQKMIGWVILILSGVGLAFIGVWPDYLFALLWLSPLLVISSLQIIGGRSPFIIEIMKADTRWEQVLPMALAALLCGFFWEMWNWKSLAHWEYSIPFVQRYHIFAMPVLGYAGYLPFGVECYIIGSLVYSRE